MCARVTVHTEGNQRAERLHGFNLLAVHGDLPARIVGKRGQNQLVVAACGHGSVKGMLGVILDEELVGREAREGILERRFVNHGNHGLGLDIVEVMSRRGHAQGQLVSFGMHAERHNPQIFSRAPLAAFGVIVCRVVRQRQRNLARVLRGQVEEHLAVLRHLKAVGDDRGIGNTAVAGVPFGIVGRAQADIAL